MFGDAEMLVFDDDVIHNLIWNEPERRPRWIPERTDYFDMYDDVDFIRRFRLSKRTALSVLEKIEEKLEFHSDKNDSITPMNQLLTTLRFYATNFHLQSAGDYGGFSKSTAHRIVCRVSAAIGQLCPQYIKFPENVVDQQETCCDFYRIARFPRVIGAMDCTHVRIVSPGGPEAEIFRNRKNYFSLNVQAICNSNMEFINIIARWQGSAHDSTIFNNTKCCANFENRRYEYFLLGDAGYPCRNYLMTPLDAPRTPSEHLYNEAHVRTRNVIERVFGVWKRRFPVLALGIRLHLQTAFAIIVATAVLHNILRAEREELPPDDPELMLPTPWDVLLAEGDMQERAPAAGQGRRAAFQARNDLIENYFEMLVRNGNQ